MGRGASRSPSLLVDMTFLLLIRRLVQDDSGQDLIEYGLLGSTIGIAGVAIMPLIPNLIQTAFELWTDNVYANSTPCDPGGC
jgi:Flp pilus assembly pilin Flp